MKTIYIFTNSPGEIFGWVQPVINRMNQSFHDVCVDIFLTPCQYSTGQEAHVCQLLPLVRNVHLPSKTFYKVLLNKGNYESGIVLFLGGDPFYPKRFAACTNSYLIGYSETLLNDSKFHHFFSKKNGYDLMISGAQDCVSKQKDGLVLLPGSRFEHVEVALPFMLEVVNGLSVDINVDIMLSPFISSQHLNQLKINYPQQHFLQLKSMSDLSKYKYALTIPGTNTAHLSLLQIPYLMILPTHRPKVLRLDGGLGLLLKIPMIGYLLKYIIIRILERRNRFYSFANLFYNEMVCPELIGRFSTQYCAIKLQELITNNDVYQQIVTKLRKISVEKNVCDELITVMRSYIIKD